MRYTTEKIECFVTAQSLEDIHNDYKFSLTDKLKNSIRNELPNSENITSIVVEKHAFIRDPLGYVVNALIYIRS